MGCGASKASVQPEPAAAKYISEPAPEKFTPPSRVAADEPLTSSFKKKATPAAAASPDASPSKKRATFDLPTAPTAEPDDILEDFDDEENFVEEEEVGAPTKADGKRRANFADAAMQRQNSFGRSRKNGDGLSRFGDTGSSKSFFLPDERERNSRVSSDEAADEAAAEIANGGSLLERKESAARHAAPAPSGLTRAMSFRQGRERALSMPDLSVYGVMTPWADKEVAHKGDGPGLKETSHATKEKDGRGNKYVNQYLIIHKIGQTSWSKVKLCLNTTDFSPYVIKEVRKSHLCGAAEGGPGSAGSSTVSAEARIKKEVAIIKKLDHPKIVAFHEVINDSAGDKLYFVMEYLAKGPVQTTSSQSGLAAVPLELAWMYFRDIVLGLEYLHARGVVHGDIKPENVLVWLPGEAKITDFGVSVASAGGARGGAAWCRHYDR